MQYTIKGFPAGEPVFKGESVLANGLRQTFLMALGLMDFLQDKFDDLKDELAERGERKSEDLIEFFDDILENLPEAARNGIKGIEDPDEFDKEPGGFVTLYAKFNLKDAVRDVLDTLGLATATDIKDISGRLERLQGDLKGCNGE